MHDQKNIQALEQDFVNKRRSYFANNYATKTMTNWSRFERREILEALALQTKSEDIVLDIGCGPAILYPKVLAQSSLYYGFDIVPSNLAEIQVNNKEVKTILGNIDDFDWELGFSPTLIICSGSLEYTQKGLQNLPSIINSLAEGGNFIATFPNRLSPSRLWIEYVQIPLKRLISGESRKVFYKRKLFSLREIKTVLEQSGLEVVESKALGYFFLPYPISRLFPKFSYKVAKFIEKNMVLLSPFASEYVLRAKKN